jgi:hypothetical protein
MSSEKEAAELAVKQIYVEGMDNGKRGILVFETKEPIHLNGVKRAYLGAILEEEQLLQLVDGLHNVADMRRVAKTTERLIKV